MVKHFLLCCFCLLSAISAVFSQGKTSEKLFSNSDNIEPLTSKQQASVNVIARNHRFGTVNLETIKKQIRDTKSLSSISRSYALSTIMMKIDEDAEKQLKTASASLQSAADRKDSLEKKMKEIKKKQDARSRLKNEYDTLRSVNSNTRKGTYDQFLQQERQSETASLYAGKRKQSAEAHLKSVKEAIRKSQEMQSPRKPESGQAQ